MFRIKGLIRGSEEFTNYCQTSISDKYKQMKLKGHDIQHINNVLDEINLIALSFALDFSIAQTIAIYHDICLIQGRDKHHIISANYLRSDAVVGRFFSLAEMTLMAEAIEDHRGSFDLGEPRSIYGKAIYDADKAIDIETIMERYIQSYLSYPKNLSKNEVLNWVYGELVSKYGENGKIKVWLNDSSRHSKLERTRNLVKDKNVCFKLLDEIYEYESSQRIDR